MRPLSAAAIGAALLAVASAATDRGPARTAAPLPGGAGSQAPPESNCPPGTLADGLVCIPVPDEAPVQAPAARFRFVERIPRRPDRPADYAAFVLPVSPATVVEDATALFEQAPAALASNLTGVALKASLGAPVTQIGLEGQKGPARVLYAGPLVGPSVVTLHEVNARGRDRRYLVVFGNLRDAPPLDPGAGLAAGAKLGGVGDAASPGAPQLYLGLYRVRAAVDPAGQPIEKLLDSAFSVAVDVRNVLALKKGGK